MLGGTLEVIVIIPRAVGIVPVSALPRTLIIAGDIDRFLRIAARRRRKQRKDVVKIQRGLAHAERGSYHVRVIGHRHFLEALKQPENDFFLAVRAFGIRVNLSYSRIGECLCAVEQLHAAGFLDVIRVGDGAGGVFMLILKHSEVLVYLNCLVLCDFNHCAAESVNELRQLHKVNGYVVHYIKLEALIQRLHG